MIKKQENSSLDLKNGRKLVLVGLLKILTFHMYNVDLVTTGTTLSASKISKKTGPTPVRIAMFSFPINQPTDHVLWFQSISLILSNLALGAVTGASSSHLDFMDFSGAYLAFLPYFPINFQLILKLASMIIRRKRPDCCSFSFNCTVNDFFGIYTKSFNLWLFEFFAQPQRMNPWLKKSLIYINISQPTNFILV